MAEKVASISKNDIETILKVNKEAIELQTQVSSQYEEIIEEISELTDVNKKLKEATEKIKEEVSDLKKIKEDISEIKKINQENKEALLKLNIVLGSGIITTIIAIIQIILNIKK